MHQGSVMPKRCRASQASRSNQAVKEEGGWRRLTYLEALPLLDLTRVHHGDGSIGGNVRNLGRSMPAHHYHQQHHTIT
jgi:hypothetical protein